MLLPPLLSPELVPPSVPELLPPSVPELPPSVFAPLLDVEPLLDVDPLPEPLLEVEPLPDPLPDPELVLDVIPPLEPEFPPELVPLSGFTVFPLLPPPHAAATASATPKPPKHKPNRGLSRCVIIALSPC